MPQTDEDAGEGPWSLAEINAWPRDVFAARFADIAEHSPWVAEAAADRRPFADVEALAGAFDAVMRAAPRERQLALIRAHPDLAGRAALAGQLAEDSRREQAGAGLDQMTEQEFSRFNTLNAAYKERFGFPFILAVKGATRHQILESFEARIGNDRQTEFDMALSQIARIFRFRLRDRVRDI
ncbi:2-oxo-4-hydroxy-4-carboxy-5-ureidoimidazoline decarboxylase [Breoghania sp. L-A4]|uniref:2-oxo-4-hydroxy-4-carboxy-5-ureidoimidazoline decarboxylase n=1 Tax=Breoghania sp. L-A4 TaxID=2304600 RepID=UPI000E35D198|nr:2-oxo-4-hydroxy-4-carboxy-5-ureidoimidazoline decarboxylase [Breoghania sp. L-A4]AXS40598.1 2-oxo-4-hydroxy-4-carboxy-5-ureidoimidazoline decarboxylase [Breoghania sp. L-A4]